MAGLAFAKMHGLGNDFVVVDARARPFAPAIAQVRALADRRTGVGCDQLIVIENPVSGLADAFMRIRNADGGEVAACGNATRCVAALLMREKRAKHAIIETGAGLLDAETAGDDPFAIVAEPAASTSAVMAGRVRACPGHPRGSNEVIVEVFPGCVGVEDKACARWFPDYALASSGLRLLVTGATRYCAPTSHPL